MKRIFFVLGLFSLALFSCVKDNDMEGEDGDPVLTQVSVIDALLQGFYDGVCQTGDLHDYGDFGIGTFQSLNGEMVLLNDTVFQVLASGKVEKPSAEVTTPFASVTQFLPDTTIALSGISYDSLQNSFSTYFPTPNLFYSVKITGEFRSMKTRSVPAQSKPYPPLAEVTKTQPVFEFSKVKGTIVGFYVPAYAQGVNVTGFHLHFLTTDRTGGGHVLAFQITNATLEIGYISDFKLVLPTKGDFLGGDFTVDRTDDLNNAEK